MAGFMKDHMRLFRFSSDLNFVRRSFFKLSALTSVVKRYVCGEKEVTVSGKRKNLDGDEIFVGESESLFYLYPTEHFYSSKQLTSSYCFFKFCYSCDYLGIGLSVIQFCLSSVLVNNNHRTN